MCIPELLSLCLYLPSISGNNFNTLLNCMIKAVSDIKQVV